MPSAPTAAEDPTPLVVILITSPGDTPVRICCIELRGMRREAGIGALIFPTLSTLINVELIEGGWDALVVKAFSVFTNDR